MWRWLLVVMLGVLGGTQVFAACLIKHPAQRVIVLAPDLVEDIFAIDAGDRIVGVIKGSDYPAAALALPLVGSYAGLDLERILSLHPDLIVTWQYAFPRQMHALQKFHIPIYVASPKQLADVPRLLQDLGCLLGKSQAAKQVAERFTRELDALQVPAHSKPQAVFIQLDENRLYTINKDSWINQAITWCGGKNIFAEAKVISPEVNREAIIVANPDVILGVSHHQVWQSAWQRWSMVRAVHEKRLYTLNPDWISRASPRLVLGVGEICLALRPAH